MLSVGDSITDDVLKEDLEDSAGLLVDEAADALDASTACQTADSGLGDALDVVAQDLAVALGSSLSESLSSLAASRHFDRLSSGRERVEWLCLLGLELPFIGLNGGGRQLGTVDPSITTGSTVPRPSAAYKINS